MRRLVGAIEALLALVFFSGVAHQFLAGGESGGAIGFAGSVVLIVLGAWFAKMAIANFRNAAPKQNAQTGGSGSS
jgi:hypothetical protein